jgi:hypothetical protein
VERNRINAQNFADSECDGRVCDDEIFEQQHPTVLSKLQKTVVINNHKLN